MNETKRSRISPSNHLEIFIGNVDNEQFNEIESGNKFGNKQIIFMSIVMKSDSLPVILKRVKLKCLTVCQTRDFPMQTATESMENTNEAGSKFLGFVYFLGICIGWCSVQHEKGSLTVSASPHRRIRLHLAVIAFSLLLHYNKIRRVDKSKCRRNLMKLLIGETLNTVDELLGIEKIASEEVFREINHEYEENRQKERRWENVVLMKNALKLFPNHPLLLVQLSTSLEKSGGTEAEKAANLRESIAVQEQILQFTEDSEIRAATLCNICYSYRRIGNYEKALEYAKKLPNHYKTRENTLAHLLSGEEKYQNSEDALQPLYYSLSLHVKILSEAECDFPQKEKLKQILQLLSEIK